MDRTFKQKFLSLHPEPPTTTLDRASMSLFTREVEKLRLLHTARTQEQFTYIYIYYIYICIDTVWGEYPMYMHLHLPRHEPSRRSVLRPF